MFNKYGKVATKKKQQRTNGKVEDHSLQLKTKRNQCNFNVLSLITSNKNNLTHQKVNKGILCILEYWTLEPKHTTHAKNGNFIFNLVNMLRQRNRRWKTGGKNFPSENIKYKIDEVKVLCVVCCLVTYALWQRHLKTFWIVEWLGKLKWKGKYRVICTWATLYSTVHCTSCDMCAYYY